MDVFPLHNSQTTSTSIVALNSNSIEEIGIIDPTEFVRQIVISSASEKKGGSKAVMETSRALNDKRDISGDSDDSDHAGEDGEDGDDVDESEEEGEESENVFSTFILKHHQGDKERFKQDLVLMQKTLGR